MDWTFASRSQLVNTSRTVAVLGWGSFLLYCFLFVFFAGTTWHSVDTIRDFHAATSIARGEYFPLASQPWAARFQTPPAYLYLLAFAVKLGAGEIALMRTIGVASLFAVWMAHRAIRSVFGANAANAYFIVSFTVTGALFGHSIGNTLLAMAVSGLLLATLLGLSVAATAGKATLLILLAALLPQMHLSGLPLAIIVLVAACASYRRAFLNVGPVCTALLLFCAIATWFFTVGGAAPEAASITATTPLDLKIAAARLLDPQQWYALLLTFIRFIDAFSATTHLGDWQLVVLRWSIRIFTLLAVCCGVFGMVSLIRGGLSPIAKAGRLIVMSTVLAFIASAAYVSAWGVWYFDALWPWLAVCIASGVSQLSASKTNIGEPIRRSPWFLLVGRPTAAFLLPIVLFVSCIVPPVALHRALARDGEMVIAANGVFYPTSPATDGLLVQLAADRQLTLRDVLRSKTACNMTVAVGLYELYLRDFTLRDTWRGCPSPVTAGGVANPVLVVRASAPYAEPVDWSPQSDNNLSPVQLLELPPQQVDIGNRRTNQLNSDIALRYTLFRPAFVSEGTLLSAASLADKSLATRLRVALRCLAPIRPESVFEPSMDGHVLRPILDGSALGIHYYLLESDASLSVFQFRSRLSVACDLMAYLIPVNRNLVAVPRVPN